MLEGLQIIMKKYCFQFGDQFFKQIDGTSMITSCTFNFATSYYGCNRRKYTLLKFSNDMLLMKRFIDNTFMIEKPKFYASKEAE